MFNVRANLTSRRTA